MYEIILKIIEKLSRNELCLLLAAATQWCSYHGPRARCPECGCEFHHNVYPPSTVEGFKEWLATIEVPEDVEQEAAQLLKDAGDRELVRMLEEREGLTPP